MKKIVLFLLVTLAFCGNCMFAQNNEAPQFTKEKAITAIRSSYLFMFFRYPEDTIANIDRLLYNINEVVCIDEKKSDKIRKLILSEIRRPNRAETQYTAFYSSVNATLSLNRLDMPNFIPIMGINANDIVRSNFNPSDYEKILERLTSDRINARRAFNYLQRLYNEGKGVEDVVFLNRANPKPFLDLIFDYFGI